MEKEMELVEGPLRPARSLLPGEADGSTEETDAAETNTLLSKDENKGVDKDEDDDEDEEELRKLEEEQCLEPPEDILWGLVRAINEAKYTGLVFAVLGALVGVIISTKNFAAYGIYPTQPTSMNDLV
jgi:hypothetical protein